MNPIQRLATRTLLAATVVLLAACGARPLTNVPVEERGSSVNRAGTLDAGSAKLLPGAENAGKPGYYSVKPGDTLIRIGLENGQNFRDLVRWNSLENPNIIEVGQVLRVLPPVSDAAAVTRPVVAGAVVAAGSNQRSPLSGASAAAGAGAPAAAPAAASAGGDEDVGWIWPAQGSLLAGFDEAKNKGLDIGGKAGDAVVASADGRVVYAGAGLRGYG
ncbi:MAG: LysM peptidoglycan-binding domain-containing protein, partial [Polaromonas sp.]|nr:LysM peptidoglycan-binding domain-containing protein [Polaromonas sp.]